MQTSHPERQLELWPELSSGIASDPAIEERVETLISELSLERKVGQMMQGEIQGVTPSDVSRYGLGSVLSAGGSYPGLKKDATAADWVALSDQYYEASMNPNGGGPGIPILWGIDAVHGHNNVVGATIFPHNIGLGAARNPDLVELAAKVTAREVAATGIKWVFAPTLAVTRDDRWGRAYESFSEDPTIVYNYAGRIISGLQGVPGDPDLLGPAHVLATAKHFVGDGGTLEGRDQGDNWSTEQALMVLHGQGYFSAIEAGVQSVMISFSSWQGEKLHGHHYLITEVLKGRLGFDGLVVSDWNGHAGSPEAGRPGVPGCSLASCDAAVNAGIDLLMVPYDWKAMLRNTIRAVEAGRIPMERVDDAVRRILRVKLRAGLFEDGPPSSHPLAGRQDLIGWAQHRAIARQAVRESLVLRKNESGLLPLAPAQNVLVAGPGADEIIMQTGGWTVNWQGDGITNADFPGATSILSGIRTTVEAAGGRVTHSPDGRFSDRPDVAIVVFGEGPYAEFEGDLENLDFSSRHPEGLEILQALSQKDVPSVAVFLTGRPLWVNRELNTASAFVVAWLPGSEGGGVADVLFRLPDGGVEHDFSGRLAFSWPKTPDQALLNRHDPEYDPLFPWGYGLQYETKPDPAQPEGVPDGMKSNAF